MKRKLHGSAMIQNEKKIRVTEIMVTRDQKLWTMMRQLRWNVVKFPRSP